MRKRLRIRRSNLGKYTVSVIYPDYILKLAAYELILAMYVATYLPITSNSKFTFDPTLNE